MDHTSILNNLASALGYNDLKKIKAVNKVLVEEIVAQDDMGIVMSDRDVVEFMREEMGKYLPFFETATKYLLGQEVIYKWGDKNSYINNVKNVNKISLSEHIMMEKGTDRGLVTVEFPIDSRGRYVIREHVVATVMSHLSELDDITNLMGYGGESLEVLSGINRDVLRSIADYLVMNVVFSTQNVADMINVMLPDGGTVDKEYEERLDEYTDSIVNYLLSEHLIYQFEDPNSYSEVVRSHDMISLYEYIGSDSGDSGTAAAVDGEPAGFVMYLEYPVDSEGRYILPATGSMPGQVPPQKTVREIVLIPYHEQEAFIREINDPMVVIPPPAEIDRIIKTVLVEDLKTGVGLKYNRQIKERIELLNRLRLPELIELKHSEIVLDPSIEIPTLYPIVVPSKAKNSLSGLDGRIYEPTAKDWKLSDVTIGPDNIRSMWVYYINELNMVTNKQNTFADLLLRGPTFQAQKQKYFELNGQRGYSIMYKTMVYLTVLRYSTDLPSPNDLLHLGITRETRLRNKNLKDIIKNETFLESVLRKAKDQIVPPLTVDLPYGNDYRQVENGIVLYFIYNKKWITDDDISRLI